MKTLRKLLLLIPIIIVSNFIGQNITNEGTDFWFGFTERKSGILGKYNVVIASRYGATGTVEVPGSTFNMPFSVAANQEVTITLVAPDVYNNLSESIQNKGIHVVSSSPVSVIAQTKASVRQEASLILPTIALGSEYYVTTQPTVVTAGSLKGESVFVIVASDTASVEITTSDTTSAGRSAGTIWQVTLNPGEIYQVKAAAVNGSDLTGSRILATNGVDKFSVYSGHVFAQIAAVDWRDPMIEVEYPTKTWGKEYMIVPTELHNYNFYRILAKDNGTNIYINGNYITTLNSGQFIQDTLFHGTPILVTTDKPSKVTQFMCSGMVGLHGGMGPTQGGDPAMVQLHPNEQMLLDSIIFFGDSINAPVSASDLWVYSTIVTRTIDTATVSDNGSLLTGWKLFLPDPTYSYHSIRTTHGTHTITTTGCGFFAYCYAMGYANSYFYSAGATYNVIADSITISNLSSMDSSYCIFDTLQFSASSTGNIAGYYWNFGDGNSSILDIPIHFYDSAGNYPISLIIDYGCSADTILDTITIMNCCPIDHMILQQNICSGDSLFLQGDWQKYAGNYYDTLINNLGCDSIITTTLTVYPIPTSSSYISICQGDSIFFGGIYYMNPGIYNDTIFNGSSSGCDSIVEITLSTSHFADASILPNNTFCQNSQLYDLQSANSGGLWTGTGIINSTNGTFDPSIATVGSHQVIYTISGNCGDADTAIVKVIENPDISFINQNDSCYLSVGAIDIYVTGGSLPYSYSWSNGSNVQDLLGLESGYYSILVTDNFGCTKSETILIEETLSNCNGSLWLPNVFSPNNDGINDVLYVRGANASVSFLFIIYDRWGEKIYESTIPSDGWDGSYKDMKMNSAVFAYMVSATFLDGSTKSKTGTITLVK